MLLNCGVGGGSESPLDGKEIKPVHPKGNHSRIVIGRLMLKLKLQYFGHLMRRTDSFEKTLMPGKIEGGRRRGRQRMRWLEASPTWLTWVWVNCGIWWWTGRPGMLQFMGSQRVRQDWATELNYKKNWKAIWQNADMNSTPLLFVWFTF